VKKNNGRRRSDGRRKKGPKGLAASAAARVRQVAAAPPQTSPRQIALLSWARDRVDWPALAILVVPLALMALLNGHSQRHQVDQPRQLTEPAARHDDLSREARPVIPEPARHTAEAPAEPELPPWHGNLALEAMPLFPEPTNQLARAPAEPPPAPWHGDLALEAMPLFPEPTSHARTSPPAVAALPPPMCLPEEAVAPLGAAMSSFGHTIAAAARAQTEDFVIYNARYMSLAYPGGDTHPLYGVCTDVVIRAYRTLGIDFQELIHTSRLGRGDASIDHRRVEVVRRFLTRHGTSLAISEFAEDYRPGDIVTYHRPEGRISQFHIAIVSDEYAPSGRPLIVHNRGWGPQVEDALFVDRITGHYRLSREQVAAFQRSRAPRASERRRRTADVSSTTRR
jgi:hypothetical protein